MARVYFHDAVELEPKWALVRGFYASTVLAEGAIHQNEGKLREDFALEDAVHLWPELNLFSGAGKYDSPQDAEAVDASRCAPARSPTRGSHASPTPPRTARSTRSS